MIYNLGSVLKFIPEGSNMKVVLVGETGIRAGKFCII
jgi:hypothetical protein